MSGEHRRGQALVEFALVVPILILLMTSLVQFAIIFERQIGIENAIREDARRSAAFVTTDANVDAHVLWAYRELSCLSTSDPTDPCFGHSHLLADNVESYSNDPSTLANIQVCYRPGVGNDPTGNVYATVDVTIGYKHPLFLPIIGPILDRIDTVPDNALRIDSTVQFRVENMKDDNNLTPVLTLTRCAP